MYRQFIKENPALAAGIGLPVLLVVLFSLAAMIPQWTVAPPRYDLLYTYTMNDYTAALNGYVTLTVSNGHIKAQYKGKDAMHAGNNNQRLYRFDSKTEAVREINFTPPAEGSSEQWSEFIIPEVVALQIDPSPKAPDGYEFRNRNGSEGVGMLFFARNYGMRPVIAKEGRVIPLRIETDGQFYSAYNIKFLGWIVNGEPAK